MIDVLLKDYKIYKDKMDLFCYRLNKVDMSISAVSKKINSVRDLAEDLLPGIVLNVNNLSDSELYELYREGQTLDIDDCDCRLDVFRFIVEPSVAKVDMFNKFKNTVKVV